MKCGSNYSTPVCRGLSQSLMIRKERRKRTSNRTRLRMGNPKSAAPRETHAAERLQKLFGELRGKIQMSGCGGVKRKAWGRGASPAEEGAEGGSDRCGGLGVCPQRVSRHSAECLGLSQNPTSVSTPGNLTAAVPSSRFSFPAGHSVTPLRAGGDSGPPRIQTAQLRVCASRRGEGVTCLCSVPHRVSFGAPTGPRLGDAPPPSSQARKPAREPARPGPLPTELTWQQQEAAQPAHHAPRPGHGPAPQPRSRQPPGPFREPLPGGQATPLGSLRPQPAGARAARVASS